MFGYLVADNPRPILSPKGEKDGARQCVKLGRAAEGLDEPPFDNELGQKIYDNVSKLAWEQWQEHMKMLLNEYRLQPWKKDHQEFIVQQMQAYFFGEGSERPKEYVPPSQLSVVSCQFRCRLVLATHANAPALAGSSQSVAGSRKPRDPGYPLFVIPAHYCLLTTGYCFVQLIHQSNIVATRGATTVNLLPPEITIERPHPARQQTLPRRKPPLHPGNQRQIDFMPLAFACGVGSRAAAQLILWRLQPENQIDESHLLALESLAVQLAFDREQLATERT